MSIGALVVTHREEIIGIGRYDMISPTSAEVAFNISDHYQGGDRVGAPGAPGRYRPRCRG